MPRDVGDVLGRLEPALDLQARHAQLDQLRDQVVRGKVLRAEEILSLVQVHELAVADDLVGHPAGLGTLAAVRRAAAQGLAGQALAGVGHAERAVDEDLDGHVRLLADLADLVQRQLAGEDDPRAAQLLRQPEPLGAGDRHLGRGVDLQVGVMARISLARPRSWMITASTPATASSRTVASISAISAVKIRVLRVT